MKIIYSTNTDWSLYNFRRAQIESSLKQNWQVGCVCSKGSFIEAIKTLGVNQIFSLQSYKKNVHIASDLSLTFEFFRIYSQWKPEIIHQFSIKPVIYGTIAARLARVPIIINTIPGLGYIFSGTEKSRINLRALVIFMYKIAGKLNDFMFFQNEDDRNLFIRHHIVNKAKTAVIPGSGVNTQYFAQNKIEEKTLEQIKKEIKYKPNQVIILMVSRMLYDKGITELVACSEKIKKINPEARFLLAGPLDLSNPAHIPLRVIEKWQKENKIEYLGRRSDVRELIGLSDIAVLPTYYREGKPRFLLEAASMGRPIITTDIPGCRDVVEDGKNGFLVPIKNIESLCKAIVKLINSPELRRRMGKESRKKAEKEFDEKIVIDQTFKIYKQLIQQKL